MARFNPFAPQAGTGETPPPAPPEPKRKERKKRPSVPRAAASLPTRAPSHAPDLLTRIDRMPVSTLATLLGPDLDPETSRAAFREFCQATPGQWKDLPTAFAAWREQDAKTLHALSNPVPAHAGITIPTLEHKPKREPVVLVMTRSAIALARLKNL